MGHPEADNTTSSEGISLEGYFDERIKGSIALHELSHGFVGMEEGAKDITITIDKHAGSTEMNVYTVALPNVYMSSFLDSKAPGTIDDFNQNVKASGVDPANDTEIKKAMHEGRVGALKSIIRVGKRHRVGGVELLNEVALLVHAEHQSMDKPLVLTREDLEQRITQAVEIVRGKQERGVYAKNPIIDEISAASLSDMDLDQKIAEAKSQMLIVTWPSVNKGDFKTKIYLGEDVQKRKDETSLDCACEGHGFHLQSCQWGKKENERLQQKEQRQTA